MAFSTENLKGQLTAGKIIHFNNDQWCEENLSDDMRGGRIEHRECFRTLFFQIWFNGTLIHSSKTWKSCEKKMDDLFQKWGCKITDINEEL